MNTKNHNLKFVLVGASGTGKTTMAHILENELKLQRCITTTTRPPREGERDGIDYYFVKSINPADMFEHISFGGYEYGISNAELTKGDFVILEPKGVAYYREHYSEPLTVIQLKRNDISIDEERRARDKAAGFDEVNPDVVIQGETIEEMSNNLLSYLTGKENFPTLDAQLHSAKIRVSHQLIKSQKTLEKGIKL